MVGVRLYLLGVRVHDGCMVGVRCMVDVGVWCVCGHMVGVGVCGCT